jgi:Amt family ammonium transporter
MGAAGKILIRALLLLLLSNQAADALIAHAEKLKHEKSISVPIPIMSTSPIPPVSSGDTAWMLAASALVLMMTLPGLALFYGGMVQSKNVVSVLAQCLACACVVSLLWIVCTYSLCFATGNPIIGDFSKAFFSGVGWTGRYKMLPETVYALFQLTFAIITPAIIVGGFAERMRFEAMLLFTTLWSLIVYTPIAHAIWGGGWLQSMGFLDFAGGVVVHTSSSVSALVAAFVIGPRKESSIETDEPHNLSYVFIGGSLLWVGWFGFNAGSACAANSQAAMAALVTQLSTASAAFAWMVTEWVYCGAPKVVGMCGGAVAGLVAITPASGYVGPTGAVVMGLVTGPVCYLATQAAKKIKFADDALDVFPVHGVGGFCGTLMTGVFASGSLGNFSGIGYAPGVTMMQQMGIQITGLLFAYVWAPTATFCILKFVDRCVGLRISDEHEDHGLDKIQHLESGYKLG